MLHFSRAIIRRGPAVIYSYFAWMRKYAKHPEKYPLELRYKRLSKIIRKVTKSLNVSFYVSGIEKLPKETFCFLSNHMSAFDPLSMFCVIDQHMTFVAKKELIKTPFIGKCVNCISGAFIDREDLKQSLKVMLKVQNELKNDVNTWLIYPEGTRVKDQMAKLNPFHGGTFRAAMKSGVPIVPVAIYGSFRILKIKPQFKKYPVHITFLEAIYPQEYENLKTEELAKIVEERIQREISFNLRKKDHEIMKDDKNYIFNQII